MKNSNPLGLLSWRAWRARARPLLPCLVIVAGCSRPEVIAPTATVQPAMQVVNASFYGKALAGQPTASGELFDPNALTSAHRTYPFGTTLQVTNPENGKSVRVRVNDRGPYVKDRALDLSQHAARQIGIEHDGVSSVQVEVIKIGPAEHR